MSKIYAKRVDANQPAIVEELRNRGYSVELDKDDIIVGYRYDSKWFEIKTHNPIQKNGKIEVGFIKDSQYEILCNYKGQYHIVWYIEQIFSEFHDFRKRKSKSLEGAGITPTKFQKNYKKWLTTKELNRLRQKKWWCLG